MTGIKWRCSGGDGGTAADGGHMGMGMVGLRRMRLLYVPCGHNTLLGDRTGGRLSGDDNVALERLSSSPCLR